MLDGVSRLCAQKPDDFAARTGPLPQADTGSFGPNGRGATSSVAVCWPTCAGSPGPGSAGKLSCPSCKRTHGRQILASLSLRQPQKAGELHRLPPADRPDISVAEGLGAGPASAAGQAAPLLAAPTHAGGWIDPRELVKRRTPSGFPEARARLLRPNPGTAAAGPGPSRRGAESGPQNRWRVWRPPPPGPALGGDEKIRTRLPSGSPRPGLAIRWAMTTGWRKNIPT